MRGPSRRRIAPGADVSELAFREDGCRAFFSCSAGVEQQLKFVAHERLTMASRPLLRAPPRPRVRMWMSTGGLLACALRVARWES